MKKKNKIVLGTIGALAVVSVATVGFSSWIVGVQQTQDTDTVDLRVDDVENDSCYLTVTLSDNEVKIAEKEAHDRKDGEIIGTGSNGIGVASDALEFAFKEIKLVVGNDITTEPTGVKISFPSDQNSVNTVRQNEFATTEDFTDPTNRTGEDSLTTSWTYLALNDISFTISKDFDSAKESSYTTYTLKSDLLAGNSGASYSFEWGTFFGGNSPVNFYNGLYATAEPAPSFETLFDAANKATTEMKTMCGALSGKTLTLKAEVVF